MEEWGETDEYLLHSWPRLSNEPQRDVKSNLHGFDVFLLLSISLFFFGLRSDRLWDGFFMSLSEVTKLIHEWHKLWTLVQFFSWSYGLFNLLSYFLYNWTEPVHHKQNYTPKKTIKILLKTCSWVGVWILSLWWTCVVSTVWTRMPAPWPCNKKQVKKIDGWVGGAHVAALF